MLGYVSGQGVCPRVFLPDRGSRYNPGTSSGIGGRRVEPGVRRFGDDVSMRR